MVQKLSGFAKFDLDTKINAYQFARLVEGIATVTRTEEKEVPSEENPDEMQTVSEEISEVDDEKFDQITSIFDQAFKEGKAPFQGDLENETYKEILAKIREFQPDQHVKAETE